jgi:predicted small secreted protein
MKKLALAFTLLSALAFTGCNSLLGKGENMETAEGVQAIKKRLEGKFGADKEVYRLSINASEHLSTDLGLVFINYLQEGKDMDQTYLVYPGDKLEEPKPSNVQGEFFLKDKKGKAAIKSFNFDQIPGHVTAAKAMIPVEYENFALNTWDFRVNNSNKVTSSFTIEVTKKGEGSTQKGRMIETKYYEFKFEVDENGKLKEVE